MGFDGNGAGCKSGEKLNQFALVIYIPNPLAGVLDELRLELVKGCSPRAHMTVLPPRPLSDVEGAVEQAQATVARVTPFEIEAGDIQVFPRTNVIYVGLKRGGDELRNLHHALHQGAWDFAEPFEYCPHITLAQDFDPELTGRLAALARRRWQAYSGPRTFPAETLTFVQNTTGNRWLDLATFRLQTPVQTR